MHSIEQPKRESAETEDQKKEKVQEVGPESERAAQERKLEELKDEAQKIFDEMKAVERDRGDAHAAYVAAQQVEARAADSYGVSPDVREARKKKKEGLLKEFEQLDDTYAILKNELEAIKTEWREIKGSLAVA